MSGDLPSSLPWDELTSRHGDLPALDEKTIYALPIGLIEAIQDSSKKGKRKGFFTPREMQFERDLTRLGGNGFFLRRGFCYPLFPLKSQVAPTNQDVKIRRRHKASEARIRELMTDEMTRAGRQSAESDDYFAKQAAVEALVHERQKAYAGWLVSDPAFHVTVGQFRERWQSRIERDHDFPSLPKSFTRGSIPVAKKDRPFFCDYSMLYRCWSLDRLETWELPVPMIPDLLSQSLYNLTDMNEAGVVLSIPWYLLRDKKLTLNELAAAKRVYQSPNHLDEWLDGRPKNWGFKRFGMMLDLFICLRLALHSRYSDRMDSNFEMLDHAFATYFLVHSGKRGDPSQTADSVRKIRQQLYRRLELT